MAMSMGREGEGKGGEKSPKRTREKQERSKREVSSKSSVHLSYQLLGDKDRHISVIV